VSISEKAGKLQARIEKWKKDLIDLTNRNVLLNFRPKRNNSIQIFEEPQKFFDLLVKDSKTFIMEDLKTSYFNQLEKIRVSEEEDFVKNKKIEEEKERFNKLLSKLRLDARTRLNEQGIQTMYLVFGVLKWKEQGNEKEFMAPLVLVPVELNRSSASQPFRIRMVDDDIVLNPFLAHKLREEKGVLLPELEDKEDLHLSKLWENIFEQINYLEGWAVLPEIYLSLFSFSKLVMYRDLENYQDLLESHPLIRAISGESSENDSDLMDLTGIPDEAILDKSVPAQESFQVLDADSSQQQAIIAAKKGVSFVLQGPPGTGKSQTISNIIAECLAMNKKVLFVSEKMAALEVVKSRLEQVGLGDFCLELHSHKANKRAVLDAFNDVINKHPERKQINSELYSKINTLRDQLNTYAEQLHKIRQPLGKSVYEVHGLLAKLDGIPELLFDFEIKNDLDLGSMTNLLTELERFRNQTILVADTPIWKGFIQPVYSLEIASKVESLLQKHITHVVELHKIAQILEHSFGLSSESIEELRKNLIILEAAKYSPNPPRHWFRHDSINLIIQQAKEYQEKMCTFLDEKKILFQAFNEGILEISLPKIAERLFVKSSDLFTTFGSKDPIVLINDRHRIEEELEKGIQSLSVICDLHDIQNQFGLPTFGTIIDAKHLSVFMSVLTKNPKPTKIWFQDFERVKTSIQETKKQFEEWKEKRSALLQKYEATIFGLDLFSLRQSLETIGSEILPCFVPANQLESADTYIFNRRTSIQQRITKLLNLHEHFQQAKIIFSNTFEVDIPNFKAIRNLKPVMQRITKDPRPQAVWFHMERHHEIYSLIQEAKGVHTKYHQEMAVITDLYEEEIIDDRVNEIFDRFENKYQSPWRVFSGAYRRDRKWLISKLKQKTKYDFDTLFKHVRSVKRILDQKKWINEKQNELRLLFGWHYKGFQTNWDAVDEAFLTVREIMDVFSGSKIPNSLREILINPVGQLDQFISEYERLISITGQMEELLISLEQEFPSFFSMWENIPIDQWAIKDVVNYLEDMQRKFDSFFENVDQLLENRKVETLSHLSLKELLKDIDFGLSIIKLENTFTEKELIYRDIMGSWYQREDTPWDRLEKSLSDIKVLFDIKTSVPEPYQMLLIEGTTVSRDRILNLEHALNKLDETLAYLREQVPLLFDDFKHFPMDQWETSRILERLKWFKDKLAQWYVNYDSLGFGVKREYLTIVDLKKDLEHAIFVQKQKQQLDKELELLKETFGHFFSGYTTNWELIFDALSWLEEWLQYFNGREVPEKLLNCISQGSSENEKQSLSSILETVTQLLKGYDSLNGELTKYFAQEALLIDNKTFECSPFTSYLSWLKKRVNSMELLEEWVRYQRLEKRMVEANLSSFLKQLQEEKPSKGTFLELFQKRFYRMWLDRIYQEEEVLYDFEVDKINEAVTNFRDYDLKSLHANAKRIQEKLEESRKHAIESLSYRKELGVLLHEIGKKRRHIAIRKLLSQTAALVLEIKPCFLMSPLSVSQFLDAREIFFDVVIFDEASQIFPEDAIGSIIRAKQVIIVGDNKQLPPTDFFKSGGIGEEFEDENEVEYESILDECMYVLPNMRLRWHYRSRHESLISFSNQAFYQNSLITFPSAEHGEDLGVKFVHVPDGIYDRGGTRSNKREAEVTAKLVFEHFRKYPNRSLGVIAFSEAQASEIRDQIDSLRRQSPEMEIFFKEGHPNEFFVKSLENVQGDERDVIFFSIGYGKAPDGSLHMNFGPLSKIGGERRLNVAVTRAKYHVKLISSLLPQDIPLERTQSIGVHRLRDYMQMAIDGSLPRYSSSQNEKFFDSPFEEDVYEVLVEMGYEVHTQVGCSGYRVDLAVVDPLKPDRYLLGIECDGKTYHSSKVARDRDRLRQQVLENLGWKIHRIWSQEWFKKRKLEVTRLKNILNKVRYE
jgi:very-short-patch-repair endonuclease